ncbi:hypothetical protein SAMN04515667_0988 [Formosa sp. Hel1_31_208]|uniref:hypothetical protein n=1 Tax=Formosa sp. Hel1_31_208 TaxID=1798225 RepID=UPI00087C3EF3|nr:hypothetical protein [Formosa sp. Hel1_31_208]SDR91840.1 hypothetical protein SAMN04515667_0988 [Formosa sp. Hel1_31_208]
MKLSLPKFSILLALLIITACAYDEDDNLNNTPNGEFMEIITTDSDLFKNLQDIASNDVRPDKSIACIDFIYPLTLFVFDNSNELLSSHLIIDDDQFSSFLEDLDLSLSISISFPITSTLSTGEEFIINTKEELKAAIDECLNEELVFECNQLIQSCIWKVGYSYNYSNDYLGGIFQESNGFTTLNVNDVLMSGSWSPFIIENELHINIGLNDTSEIGTFFNFDWKVEYLDENSFLLKNGDRELVLNQRCDPEFADCGNFVFEVCETEIGSGISEFILDDYTFCIFDTLELDEAFDINYYETQEEALNSTNAIISSDVFINSENNQSIFVRIDDDENDMQYVMVITLSSIDC